LENGKRDAGEGARTALRCVCGYTILCEVQPGGEYIGFLVFFDGEPTSETYGQRVKNCPGCGELIGLPVLSRINRLG
jgi:hypothetical protein